MVTCWISSEVKPTRFADWLDVCERESEVNDSRVFGLTSGRTKPPFTELGKTGARVMFRTY